jgi:hypothetical protein
VFEFILNGLAVIYCMFIPLYIGSAIGKVAPHTGYVKPVLGLLVAIPASFMAPYVLWRSEFHSTSWLDADVFTKWLLPLTGLFAYGYLLEFIEALKSDKRDKNERSSASPKVSDNRRLPISGRSYGVAVSNSEYSGGVESPVARKRVKHGHIQEQLRVLLTHPIILLVSFCASVLTIIGFFLQFFLGP